MPPTSWNRAEVLALLADAKREPDEDSPSRSGCSAARFSRERVLSEAEQQILDELVMRDAGDVLGVDDHVLLPPFQSHPLARGEVLIAAHDQHPGVANGALAEPGFHVRRVCH